MSALRRPLAALARHCAAPALRPACPLSALSALSGGLPAAAPQPAFAPPCARGLVTASRPILPKAARVALVTPPYSYLATREGIRHSPWRMALLASAIRRLDLREALAQMLFSKKRFAPLVKEMLEEAAVELKAQHGLVPAQLEVHEAFVTQGERLKRIKMMGRGRTGIKHHLHCHVRVTVAAIPFEKRLKEAKTRSQEMRLKRMLRRVADERNDAGLDPFVLGEHFVDQSVDIEERVAIGPGPTV